MTANIRPGYLAAIAVAYLVSLASWSRLPEPFCGPGCSVGLARTLIAFALPTAIVVVVTLLGVVWQRDPIRDRDVHSESAYHAVVRTVVVFVLGLHLAILFALTSQLHPDVVRAVAHAVPVMFGLALIVIGNLLPRFRPNLVAGIRTARTLGDRAAWAHTNRAAGYATVGSGVSFLLAGLLPNLPVMEFASVAAFGMMTAFVWRSWRSTHA